MENFFCAVYFEKNISEPAWYPGHSNLFVLISSSEYNVFNACVND